MRRPDGGPRKALTTTAIVAGVVAVLALSACSAPKTPEKTFPNTPEALAYGKPGERVELRHESGLTYELLAGDGGVLTPVLWDGTWRVRTGGKETLIRIGVPAPDGNYRHCWAETRQGGDRLSGLKPGNVVCAQATALADGGLPYERQHEKVRSMLDWLDLDTTRAALRGWYCHLVGEVSASAAVLHGQDGDAIVDGNASHCNFSVIHGVAAGRVAPGVDLQDVCTHRETRPLSYDAYMTQCWHGIGMGLSRIHRFDIAAVDDACSSAGDAGWAKNCIEGALNFANNYRLRVGSGEWGPEPIDPRWCADAAAAASDPRAFSDVCYRVAAKQMLERTEDAVEPARRLADACRELATEIRRGCTVAAGALAGQLIVGYDRGIEPVKEAIALCAGTDGGYDDACLERLYSALLVTAQNPKGFAAELLLEQAPQTKRADLRAHLERQAVNTAGIAG